MSSSIAENFELEFGEITFITNKDFETLDNRPSYAGELMTGDTDIPAVNDATLTIKQNGTVIGTFTANDADDTEIDLDDTTYTAGDNITIEDGEINATDTTYTAGNGINIDEDNDNAISVDTDTIATRNYADNAAETAAAEAIAGTATLSNNTLTITTTTEESES